MRRILAVLLVLLAAVPASAAIAVDATAAGAFEAAVTSKTWSHTTSGSDRILFAAYAITSTTDIGTGCTYNGVAMTLVHGGNNPSTPTGFSYLYMLVNPATGANNIVCSTSGTTGIEGVSASYTGAAQAGQPDSSNEGTSDGPSPHSLSTTVVASNSWLVALFRGTNTPSAGTGTTLRRLATDISFGLFDSNGTVGTGSQALAVTYGGAVESYAAIASFSPAGGATLRQRAMSGVGQ